MDRTRRWLYVGAALIALTPLFTTILPAIGYQVVDAGVPPGQAVRLVVEFVSRFLGSVLPYVGAAFLAAGLVLRGWGRDSHGQQ